MSLTPPGDQVRGIEAFTAQQGSDAAGVGSGSINLCQDGQFVVGSGGPTLRADATIDSHRSNRIVPGWQSRMSFEGKTADLLWIG